MNGQVSILDTRKYGTDHPVIDLIGLAGDNTILGPIFLGGVITGEVYLDMISQQVVSQLHQRDRKQQNGAKWMVSR